MSLGPAALAPLAAGLVTHNPVSKAMFRAAATAYPQSRNAMADVAQNVAPAYLAPGIARNVLAVQGESPRNAFIEGGQ
jgi:hypothetical protein